MKALLFVFVILAAAMTLASCEKSEQGAAPPPPAITDNTAPQETAPPAPVQDAEEDITVDVTGPGGQLPEVAVREADPQTLEPLPEDEVINGEPLRTAQGRDGLAVDLLRAEVDQGTYFVALRYRNPDEREMELIIDPVNASYTTTDDRRFDAQAVFPEQRSVVAPPNGSAVVQIRFPPPADNVAAVDIEAFGVRFDDVLVNRPG